MKGFGGNKLEESTLEYLVNTKRGSTRQASTPIRKLGRRDPRYMLYDISYVLYAIICMLSAMYYNDMCYLLHATCDVRRATRYMIHDMCDVLRA